MEHLVQDFVPIPVAGGTARVLVGIVWRPAASITSLPACGRGGFCLFNKPGTWHGFYAYRGKGFSPGRPNDLSLQGW